MALDHIGRYEVQRRLGTGGMGSLYLARDPGLDRLVAIKLLKEQYQDDPEIRERFTREARSVARLRHRNIIIVHEIGEAGGRPFIVMEYVAGETLTQALRRTPPPPLAKRLSFVEELCAGLAHAHAADIIHRDIKPANIMLDQEGVLKILDFGIARLGKSGMTQEGMMMGTVNYMSPEQVVGRRVDHRTDIFATGAVLYEVIALEQAFPGWIDSGVLHRILTEGPVPLTERVPGVNAELARIVHRALDREPGLRYQNLNDMRRDLMQVRQSLMEAGDDDHRATSAVDRTVVSRPKSSAPGTGRRTERDRRDRLEPERRAELQRQQVAESLRLAEDALASGNHDAALQHAERASMIDPESRVADDLIDRARFAIESKSIRRLLVEAERLLSEGRVDDAAALTEEASETRLDGPGASELLNEVRTITARIAAVRDRERRIQTSLERARTSIEQTGYETALRAVYEVLALDPERAEARELEQVAKARLQAKREHEQSRRAAYDALKAARELAHTGRYDEATDAINSITPPSDTVSAAATEALVTVRRLQRQAAHDAILAQARAAFDAGQFEQTLAAIESIPGNERKSEAHLLQSAAERALSTQRELEQKRQMLDTVVRATEAFIENGDLAAALQRLDEGSAIRLDDERLILLRRRIAKLQAIAEEQRREQEERVRREAERVRREQEAQRQAEEARLQAEEARRREEQRRGAERRRQEEEERLRQAKLARHREEVATVLKRVEGALAAERPDEATLLLREADRLRPADVDPDLKRRLAAARVEVERLADRERKRLAEEAGRQEEAARLEVTRIAREEHLRRENKNQREREDREGRSTGNETIARGAHTADGAPTRVPAAPPFAHPPRPQIDAPAPAASRRPWVLSLAAAATVILVAAAAALTWWPPNQTESITERTSVATPKVQTGSTKPTPPITPSEPTAPPNAPTVGPDRPQAAALLTRARQLYESGNAAGALRLVDSARGLDPDNPEPSQQIDRWLAAAGSTAAEARRQAENTGQATTHPTFREADSRKLAAEQHGRAGRKTQAIESFIAATQLFRQVSQAIARGRGPSVEGPLPGPTPLPDTSVQPRPSQPIQPPVADPLPPAESATVVDKPAVAPPRPAVDTSALERQAILGVLQQFAAGYNSMSVGTMQRAFPTLDTQVYARTFSSFSALDWRYENPVITFTPNGSEAQVNTGVYNRPDSSPRTGTPARQTNQAIRATQAAARVVDRRERRPRPGPIAHQDLLSPRALDSDRWSDARLEPLFIDRDEYTGVEEEVPSDMHFYTGRYLEQAQLLLGPDEPVDNDVTRARNVGDASPHCRHASRKSRLAECATQKRERRRQLLQRRVDASDVVDLIGEPADGVAAVGVEREDVRLCRRRRDQNLERGVAKPEQFVFVASGQPDICVHGNAVGACVDEGVLQMHRDVTDALRVEARRLLGNLGACGCRTL